MILESRSVIPEFNSRASSCRVLRVDYYPTRTWEREWKNPNTLPSHHSTPMTTIAFKIDLMEFAIGMN